jgi:hypothetical protein
MDGIYRLQNEAGVHPGEIAGLPDRRAGTVFVLTSSGLRHMGLRPGPARTNATGRGFLGYLQEEIFWKDAFELVHEDDLPLLSFLVSLVMEEPGPRRASKSVSATHGANGFSRTSVCSMCWRPPPATTRDFSW